MLIYACIIYINVKVGGFAQEFYIGPAWYLINFGYCSYKGHDMLAPFTAGWQSTDLDTSYRIQFLE